jgi:glycosyltransferase involved in cell wall biosynthesis
MASRVTLLGAVSEHRVIDLLEDAHVFALASYEEPLGVSVMEAMSMEMPVVVTRSPGISELVEHETHGLVVPPQDEPKFADALRRIAQDPELAAALGRNGRQRVQERFSVRRSAELIAAFLSEIEPARTADQAVAVLQDLRK